MSRKSLQGLQNCGESYQGSNRSAITATAGAVNKNTSGRGQPSADALMADPRDATKKMIL